MADDFEEAWSACHASLLRFAGLLTGDRASAEDLVAEAFARTWVRWRLGKVENLEPYLKRAVVNGCRDRARRKTIERRRGEITSGEPSLSPDSADASAVRSALADLGPRQRAVVVLRFYEDRTEADIAALLGIRVGTVKSQLSRGLARLRLALEEGEDVD